MPDNAIRCDKCGVVLVDPRRKKIRSCSHYPLTIEKLNVGGEDASHIGLGTTKSQKYRDVAVVDFDFNHCFNVAMEWGKKLGGVND